ncbi:MAG: VanZ family protein [Pseudomonadota bacterium]
MRSLIHQVLLTPAHANLRYRGALVLYLLILVLGSIPGARADIGRVASGLALHSCAYAVLTFLLFTGGSGNGAQRAVKAVLIVMAMGALDETVQAFLSYRHGAVSDWVVDTVSSLATASLMWTLWRRHKVLP